VWTIDRNSSGKDSKEEEKEMKVLDDGHTYLLLHLDGAGAEKLSFVKREGPGYPGNEGHYEGTNIQEVLRALIDRSHYLYDQVPCSETLAVIANLRSALLLLELRAARRHGRHLDLHGEEYIEDLPVCPRCGHIGCDGTCHEKRFHSDLP
jgi:hypothetical protein